jgi:hypothetical protein
MLNVYLDKNVLSHILKVQRTGVETNQVSSAHVKKLHDAVAQNKIRNLMSVMQIQEAAYALNSPSETVAQEELKLIRDLLYQKEMIKFPNDLLCENVINYAQGKGPPAALTPNIIDLDGLFSSKGDIEERKQALANTRKQEAEFLDIATGANDNDREIILAEFQNVQPNFEEFYQAKIIPRLTGLVKKAEEHCGLNGLLAACEKRGIEGMMNFRTLAIAEGASLSYQYARVFGELREKEKHRKGDSPDLKHALLSSAADVLVTHDRDFAFWFARVPSKGVEVMDQLHKLLDRVSTN